MNVSEIIKNRLVENVALNESNKLTKDNIRAALKNKSEVAKVIENLPAEKYAEFIDGLTVDGGKVIMDSIGQASESLADQSEEKQVEFVSKSKKMDLGGLSPAGDVPTL